jgi:drug/metabolite transporter (DMT)-like permease
MLAVGLGLALVTALFWAISAACYRRGEEGLSSITANFVRVIPPFLVLAALALVAGVLPLVSSLTLWTIVLIVVSGLFAFVIGDNMYFVALRSIGVSRATPITYLYPLFVVAIQLTVFREPVHPLVMVAVVCAAVGVAFVSSGAKKAASASDSQSPRLLWTGVLTALGTAMCWGISISLLAEVLRTTDLVLVAILRLAVALLAMMPIVFSRQATRREVVGAGHSWLLLGIGGVVGLAVGYLTFASALELAGTTSATVLSSLAPLFAVVIGWRGLRERVGWRTVSGVLACLAGIILTTLAAALV